MRFNIKFKLSGKKQFMPFNYQYPVSAWIYKVFGTADNEFTNLLHEHGYQLKNGKAFKLFTFSKLNFPKHTWKPGTLHITNSLREAKGEKTVEKNDRMEIWARNARLTVSFHLPEQIEKFVMGLFQEQKAFIGDKVSGIELEVESIETLKNNIPDSKTIKLKTITPIVLGVYIEKEKHEQYVSPLHPEYKKIFLNNLLDKYRAISNIKINTDDWDFTVLKLYPKTSMQTIKAFTSEETRVRGYNYEFELTAPKEIIEIGLNAGFGSMNSVGFGFGEMVI
jgi:CRISPR-associated endoribonuclease Cas6